MDKLCAIPILLLVLGLGVASSASIFIIKLLISADRISLERADRYLGQRPTIVKLWLVLLSGTGFQDPLTTPKWPNLALAIALVVTSLSIGAIAYNDNTLTIEKIIFILVVLLLVVAYTYSAWNIYQLSRSK